MNESSLLTCPEAAALLRVSESKLRLLVKAGTLTAAIPDPLRITRQSVDRLLNPTPAAPKPAGNRAIPQKPAQSRALPLGARPLTVSDLIARQEAERAERRAEQKQLRVAHGR